MSFLGFQAMSAAWLSLLFIPLVVLYFLKLKRPRRVVPSLVLWRRVIDDKRVNAPFQKFKRNILLLLQLLLLALIVLAAMHPYRRGDADRAERLPILIDISASMAALDKPGGSSRLEEAKNRVGKMIDEMLSGQEICLISFSRRARKLTDFTNNKRLLREALEKIETEDSPSDIENAFRLVQALGVSRPFDEAILFSDGNFPPATAAELSFELKYRQLKKAGPNIGITAINALRSTGGRWSVFILIEDSGEGGDALVEASAGGRDLGGVHVSLPPGGSERIVFETEADRPTFLEVKLSPDGFDSLLSDNVAYLDLPAARPLDVYIPEELEDYRAALGAAGGVRFFPDNGRLGDGELYDLAIVDGSEKNDVQAKTILHLGVVPEELKKLVSVDRKGAEVVDWRRDSELLRYVELGAASILDRPAYAEGAGEADLERLGYETLVHGDLGPLLVEKRGEERLEYFILFHTDRSTLPYRIGFPIMVSNLIRIAMRETGLGEARGNKTGVVPPFRLAPDRKHQIRGPNGFSIEKLTDGAGTLAGVEAPRAGAYRIYESGSETMIFGAALLSPGETQLEGTPEIGFDEGLSVARETKELQTDRPLWRLLALLAFILLLVEWWLFHRRSGGYAK